MEGLAGAADRTFDLLVVGGGIFGVGAAREAALNGWSVCLCERDDLASETSSRSSKLIHGGLRYLESFEIGLVRQALRERAVLRRLAPNLVRVLPFLAPVRPGARVGATRLRAGLFLYDALAGSTRFARRAWLSAADVRREEPALAFEGLRGAGRYADAQALDSRLVVAVARGAAERGAVILTRAEVADLSGGPPDVFTARIRTPSGDGCVVRARAVIAAVGPFSDSFRARLDGGAPRSRLTSGAHIVLPGVLRSHALTLTAVSDGRVFFMMPFFGRTLVGTTDRDHAGDPRDPATAEADVAWLLAEANAALGDARFTSADVIASFTGLRTLARDDAAQPSRTSREQAVFEEPRGCVHVIGGKLTTWRLIGRELVERATPHTGRPLDDGALSLTTPLPGAGVVDPGAMDALARASGFPPATLARIADHFGSDLPSIVALATSGESSLEPISPLVPESPAEFLHCARHEWARTAADVLRRRLPRALLDRVDPAAVPWDPPAP